MIEPKLRFKADDGSQFPDWEEKTIDEVAECLDNKRVPVNSEERKKRVGIIPYYGAGGIQGYIDDYLFDEELVLLLEDGDAFDDFQTKSIAQYVTGKSWVNNHAHVLRANGNSYFLFASLEHKDIRRWTQLAGASRKKLLKDSMLKITVNMPSFPEQQKIADFLSTIDTVIEKQKETVSAWEERKKGVMQKLFSREVRFKADDGSAFPEWEKKPFGDVVSEYKMKTKVENEDTLLSCAINGVFLNSELFGHQRGQSNIGYLKIKKGTLILSAQNLHLGNANVNLKFEHGIISPAYKTYDIVGCSAEYMSQWMKWDMTKQFFYNATTVGASECRRNVDWNMLYSQLFAVPCLAEQQKIADCLLALDEVIKNQKATLSAWEELKKGLLQQMFV
ncbi:TPA: hypothetical protein CPT93_02400 [Candidatus Gastranaerophilales bacterium HUM_7]|nr:MAG TPA: hypothetical protein CPT93_02400 [Candidatus Gastranaerophilales bacterium HUM_7]